MESSPKQKGPPGEGSPFLINKTSIAKWIDLIGHFRRKYFVDDEGVTGFFLYEGLDIVFSTKCGK